MNFALVYFNTNSNYKCTRIWGKPDQMTTWSFMHHAVVAIEVGEVEVVAVVTEADETLILVVDMVAQIKPIIPFQISKNRIQTTTSLIYLKPLISHFPNLGCNVNCVGSTTIPSGNATNDITTLINLIRLKPLPL